MSAAPDLAKLAHDGFVELELQSSAVLTSMQACIDACFPCPPVEWHTLEASFEQHVALVDRATQAVAAAGLVEALLLDLRSQLVSVLGPAIDRQAVPHIRVSRPSTEGDFVDWHRDTFYGNSPWEMNVWVPVHPLAEGAGLRVLAGSHAVRSRNVVAVEERNENRRTVARGSVANRVGYTYAPKADDTIATLDPARTTLLAPAVGRAVLFFGHMVHRAQNTSTRTRVTVDVRVKSSHAPTGTKAGYYVPLCRGPVETIVAELERP